MGQEREPVEVHVFEQVGRQTHHMLLLFALPAARTRSHRQAENPVSFLSVAAHNSTPRFLEPPVPRLALKA
jgi:hypothetical protein